MLHGRTISRRALLVAAAAVGTYALAEAPRQATDTILSSDGRDVTVWAWQPPGARRGVVLFSHGFGCAPWKYGPLLKP